MGLLALGVLGADTLHDSIGSRDIEQDVQKPCKYIWYMTTQRYLVIRQINFI